MSTSIKLARFLLHLGVCGQKTERGARIHCSFTQEEIGLFIGACQETVTMTLSDFESLGLLQQDGSTFVIPSLRALEIYAGQVDYGRRPDGNV
jgi:CRP-like cAMP-binding protein